MTDEQVFVVVLAGAVAVVPIWMLLLSAYRYRQFRLADLAMRHPRTDQEWLAALIRRSEWSWNSIHDLAERVEMLRNQQRTLSWFQALTSAAAVAVAIIAILVA
jgi:hypothetical protein